MGRKQIKKKKAREMTSEEKADKFIRHFEKKISDKQKAYVDAYNMPFKRPKNRSKK